ncbi:phthioceranic/hydroxyphthioceranic acid synthase-like [Bufo bufo]|uniref:phthioceranic/hydroxyphthioceranic acid synthase-like n=1 Tax=Bufo bufo TaxID=8384 RepID=UPI001ABE3845|nr:phthioceranic/hydroxyphthioceranic acid synthase-like [Bufo bufo]
MSRQGVGKKGKAQQELNTSISPMFKQAERLKQVLTNIVGQTSPPRRKKEDIPQTQEGDLSRSIEKDTMRLSPTEFQSGESENKHLKEAEKTAPIQEEQVPSLQDIFHEIKKCNSAIQNLSLQTGNIKEVVGLLRTDLQKYKDRLVEVEKRTSDTEELLQIIVKEKTKLKEENTVLKNKLLDLENRSRRSNLRSVYIHCLIDKFGHKTYEQMTKLELVREYLEDIYSSKVNKSAAELQQFLGKISIIKLTTDQSESLEAPLDSAEVETILSKITKNKTPGEGIDNFWKVLVEGKNCTIEIPEERFNVKHWYDPDYDTPGKICTTRAALVEGFNEFDHKPFGIYKSETEIMDPQQKLLLECTYRALEDGGYPMESISGSETGVFIGLMNRDSESIYTQCADNIKHFNGTGTSTSIAANRISYCFNLTGPSLSIDTACSSSLVALHYACQSIRQGDCCMAICGGVSCIIEPRVYVALSKAKMISPEGTSKPFSNKADGYGRGEGCGVILLKPLKKAIEDCNKIWGIIYKTAVNQDGRSVSPITKPSQYQQEKLMQQIYKTIDPCSVQYVEAHGTGTPIGDPTEAASLGNIFGKIRPIGMKPLKIGSVKGNIGHTESAAGVAGLIKVLLMMNHEIIPPSLHYSKENGIKIIEESNLEIPTKPQKWLEDITFGRIAAINCFGFGGTNAHVVVKQYKQKDPQYHSKRPVELFILSAASSQSLQLCIEDTKQMLRKTTSLTLENLVYTAACRRSHLNDKYRIGFLASSLTHLQQQLEIMKKDTAQVISSPSIAFVFCGNGLIYKGMCKMLLELEPVFKNKCIEIDEVIRVYTPLSVVQLLEKEFDEFSRPDVAQLLLFTIQVSLVALLKNWGVKPDCILGHSVGEVAAAHCSGLLSLEDAVKVIYYRSTLQCKAVGGKMLVVGNITITDVSNLVASYKGKICIAAYNSPTSCTVSGDGETIDQLNKKLSKDYSSQDIFLHVLDVPAAYHSHMMDPILNEIKEMLRDLQEHDLEVDLFSTVTGKPASKGDFTTGDYWGKNIREPVAFQQAIKASAKDKEHTLFIEIGPRRALQRNIIETLGPNTTVLPALQPNKEYDTIFSMLIELFTHGYNPDWCNVFDAYKSSPSTIPRYQFDHIKQDIKFEKIRQGNQTASSPNHPLIRSLSEDFTEFQCIVSKTITPYVYEHTNWGSALIPGAFYVELGLAAAAISFKPKLPLNSLKISVIFSNPCVLQQDSVDLKIKLHQEDKVTNFEVLTSHVFASGKIQKHNSIVNTVKGISTEQIFSRCTTIFKIENIYEQLSTLGFEYGKAYKQLGDVHYGNDLKEGIARLKVSEEVRETMYEYHIHPVILDCFLQMGVCVGSRTKDSAIFPSSIESLTILQPLQEEMIIYMKTIKTTEKYIELCGCFADKTGSILVEIKSAKMSLLKQTEKKQVKTFYQVEWTQCSQPSHIPEHEPKMLIFSDTLGIGEKLSKYMQNEPSYIIFNSWDSNFQDQKILNSEWTDVVFMWGIQRVSENIPNNLTQYLAKCCEVYRQLILAVSKKSPKPSIRTVTFRTVDNTVDNINPGFAFVGMTRASLFEMPDITFQLIDISSTSPQDVKALAQVVHNYNPEDHPEIWINEGSIYANEIIFSDTEKRTRQIDSLQKSNNFTLYTSEPYTVTNISAEQSNHKLFELKSKDLEICVDEICIHTDDYFPISLSSWKYGNALYWNSLTSDKHELVALDFAGIVTAVGKGVKKIQVGDRVAACYPITATSKVTLPENVCYLVKKAPVIKSAPCISFFVLAWEILHNQLPCAKNKSKLAILTSDVKSVLCRVLSKTAKQSGWETVISAASREVDKQCTSMVILPTVGDVSREVLNALPFLKDVVLVSDHKNDKNWRNIILSSNEDFHVHLLDISAIFQKAYLQQHSKNLHKWLYSITSKNIINIPKRLIQPSWRESDCHIGETSYFTSQSLPVIELDNSIVLAIPMSALNPMLFKDKAVYIVTGGLTGLGFETVKFIGNNGGGHLVILSRRKSTPEMEQHLAEIQNQNETTKIVTISCDISCYAEVKNAMDYIKTIFPNIPVKGVFHSAVVFHDRILQNLSLSLFEKVLSPKVDGVVNLHLATLNMKLDYFVCYSSIASFVGNSGQANYAAANSFLEMFCQYRRNMGLCGQAISWGALDLGILLNQSQVHRILEAKGILLLSTVEIHEHLKKCLQLNNPNQAIFKFNFKTTYENLMSQIPALKRRLFNVVLGEMSSWEQTSKENQSSNSNNSNNETCENYILLVVTELTGVSPSDITMSTLLSSLGIDSMSAMTLQSHIRKDKNVNIPLVKLLDPNTTISNLVSLVKETTGDKKEIGSEIIEETLL